MSQPPVRVLVVDDEPQIRRLLRLTLERQDYQVIDAATGLDGVAVAAEQQPDLIILDLGLPDIDGVEVVRRIRDWSAVPIVILSVRNRDDDKVGALDAGADDYVNKPFSTPELLARLRAALRHRLKQAGEAPVFRSDDLAVDLVRRRVTRAGQEVRLSPRQYDLLRFLVQHAGRVVTHRQILTTVWGPAHGDDTQYLRVFVGQLRQKLERDPSQPELILTEPGVGYRLVQREDG